MKLEFKIYELTEEFGIQEFNQDNEFIIVGQKEDYYLVQPIINGELKLIKGLNIQDSAYMVPKNIIKLQGPGWYADYYEFDIDIEHLNMQIILQIQQLNN